MFSLSLGVTEADVKFELARHKAEPAAKGVLPLHSKLNASAFIVVGLNLQEQQ